MRRFGGSWILVFLWVAHSWGITVSAEMVAPYCSLTPMLLTAVDSSASRTIDEVRKGVLSFRETRGAMTWGFSRAAVWGLFDLRVSEISNAPLLLELSMPLLDEVDYWLFRGDSLIHHVRTGYAQPFESRAIRHRHFVFPIPQRETGNYRIYLRIRSIDRLEMPLTLWQEKEFFVQDQRNQLYIGLFLGLAVGAIVILCYMFWIFRDSSYGYYALFMLFFAWFFAGQMGFVHEYLWPVSWNENNHYMYLCIFGILISLVLLTRSYLEIDSRKRFISGLLCGLFIYLIIALAVSVIWLDIQSAYMTAVGSVAVVMTIILGISAWSASFSRIARYYLVAWALALVSGIGYALRAFGIIAPEWVPVGLLALVWVVQFVLVALGLGERLVQIRREKEALQEQVIENLRKSTVMKDEFLANTSHELRTPLNGIIGIAESLLEGVAGPLSAGQKENLRLIINSGRRLANLVNDILDLLRMKNGELSVRRNPVDLYQIASMVIGIHRLSAQRKNLALLNDIEESFPCVWGDEERIQQILHNLVDNAIKFTESGEICISAVARNQWAEICVADTGMGIEPGRLREIFEHFHQLDGSVTRQASGLGLGLALCRYLVRLHGGELRAESQPGQGSRFFFTLSIVQEQVPREVFAAHPPVQRVLPREIEVPEDIPGYSGYREARILVVDDEPINVKLLTKQLSNHHYRVMTASNGADTLRILERGDIPDLILLDVMMPRMSGYEVCRRIRERWDMTLLPVLMVTARNQIADLVEGLESGANDYITKPFSQHELLARVKAHLALSKVSHACARFVPREFLRLLGRETIAQVRLGDHVEREMTVMFSGIRSFPVLSEQMSAEENINFLNSFLSRIAPRITRSGGIIDKYLDGGVMALFPAGPSQALDAALQIVEEMRVYNEDRARAGYASLEITVGLHCGSLMLGTIGDDARMDGTVIADAVNVAARLEKMNLELGTVVLLSEDLFWRLSEEQRNWCRCLGLWEIRGKRARMRVYEMFACDLMERQLAKRQTREEFENAVRFEEMGDLVSAVSAMRRVLGTHADDRVAAAVMRHWGHRTTTVK